jgi:hypothetical protein
VTARGRLATRLGVLALSLSALSSTALAHSGSLRGDTAGLSVPTWLFLATGGGVVGASFLLSTFATDRRLVSAVHGWRRRLGAAPPLLARLAPALGGLAVVFVVAVGLTGPADGTRNAAIYVVWVLWWAGAVICAYLVGDVWAAVNPFRALADRLPTLGLSYPEHLGVWPSAVGLLALVFVEVVTPLADDPRLLAGTVLVYAGGTLAGAAAFGPERWFSSVDPVARTFAQYGQVAPIGRGEDGGLSVRLPGMALAEPPADARLDAVGFVIAVVWATSFDGLVTTPAWADLVGGLADLGVPALATYVLGLAGGYLLFLGTYLAAARAARRTSGTYLTTPALARRFAPALLVIAAGYHLAHYLPYLLSLWPALVATVGQAGGAGLAAATGGSAGRLATVPRAVLPGWVRSLSLTFVLLGHLLAVWVAHAAAFETFPERLTALRSQIPITAAMIVYTVVGLWIVVEPSVAPPGVGP